MQLSIAASSVSSSRHHGSTKLEPAPRAGGGAQGFVGDLIRGGASGYQAATHQAGVRVDRASIHPFETVTTATGLLKQGTASVKYVNKATGLLHTGAGLGMLILASNLSGTVRAPGNTAVDLGHRVADLIDGRKTASALGWGVSTDAETGRQQMTESSVGSALGSLGMR